MTASCYGRRVALATTVLAAALTIHPLQADAAEISVLTPPNMKAILTDLTADFHRASGDVLAIQYAPADAVKRRILGGDAVDAAITLKPLTKELAQDGKMVPGSIADVGRSFIAVAVRSGVPKPDISSIAAFKRSLLAASSIAYSDPPKGGISGVYFAALLDRLGLAEEMQPKTKLVPPGGAALVAALQSGEADIGIDQLSSFLGQPGLDVVGVLPSEFGVDIIMSAGVVADAKQPAAAAAFVKFLSTPAAAAAIKAHGMQPG
jgi:molybdate transport system substrate-binding protein